MIEQVQAGDPADTFEQKEKDSFLAKVIVRGTLSLPRRQQYAMLWHLKNEVLDESVLTDAFLECGIDLEAMEFPTDKAELTKLRSLRTLARKKLQVYIKQYIL